MRVNDNLIESKEFSFLLLIFDDVWDWEGGWVTFSYAKQMRVVHSHLLVFSIFKRQEWVTTWLKTMNSFCIFCFFHSPFQTVWPVTPKTVMKNDNKLTNLTGVGVLYFLVWLITHLLRLCEDGWLSFSSSFSSSPLELERSEGERSPVGQSKNRKEHRKSAKLSRRHNIKLSL